MADQEDKRKKVNILTDDGAYETFNANPQENTMIESLKEKKRLGFNDGANAERLYQARKKMGYGGD